VPFNFLLWNHLDPGKTSFGEQGKRATLKPVGNESVLTFAIDNSDFRQHFHVKRVCDSLFFYRARNTGPVVRLVELKGGPIQDAAAQLGETLTALRDALRRYQLTAEFRAVVIASRRALKDAKPVQKVFEVRHGIPLTVTRGSDLRRYL
jgi:hypothetical protein